MKIESLVVEKLYGYINFDVKFYSDVNVLIGINGSGKTSILNVLAWVLGPSLRKLAELEFNKIQVVFEVAKNEKRKLIAQKKKKGRVELRIEGIQEKLVTCLK